jgi:3-deoxy-manno-octulosonate cytidylyltransferase (CMP-KDO synthetase)
VPPTTPFATIIVPARLASTRLPRKVLLARTGRPMVQHVVDQAAGAACAAEVVVATDAIEVVEALRPFGTRVILTRPDHPNGTSRLAEAARLLNLPEDALVVNAQGDEPEMPGAVIDAAAAALTSVPRASVGTVCCPLSAAHGEEHTDGSIAPAMYFSRAPIPVNRDGQAILGATPMRHVGVYAYRVGFLQTYVTLPPTPLEQAESLEQLRVLEHGYTIAVARCDAAIGLTGIDTQGQYDAFVERHRCG